MNRLDVVHVPDLTIIQCLQPPPQREDHQSTSTGRVNGMKQQRRMNSEQRTKKQKYDLESPRGCDVDKKANIAVKLKNQ
jgi:hypothetical protein